MQEELKNKIQFTPLTPGLGFHPFSDGLPYAPVTKAGLSESMGTGAVSAGAPKIARQPQRPLRVSVPTPFISAQPTPAEIEPAEQKFGYWYLLKRIFAYSLDSIVNLTLCLATFAFAFWKQGLNLDGMITPGILALSALFLIVFNWALITAQEVAFNTSLGKRSFGLILPGTAHACFWRAFFFLISVGFCGVGLMWALFKRNKRCWHDVAMDLQPIEIARL